MKIIPAVDIIGGRTVRLEQGEFDRKLSYEVSPVEAARQWETIGAELIHVVDLDGAKEGRPVNLSTVREIVKAVNIPVEAGGGFRRELDIKDALNHGVWRVIVGSQAFTDIDFARDCIENFRERVVISVDAEGYKPRVKGWEEAADVDFFDILRKFASFGAKEIIFTDIKKDGTLSGPDMEKLKDILEKVDLKVVYAGGVKTVEHLKELKKLEPLGLKGVIVGRALYDGTINLKEAIDACKENNPVS